MPVEQWMRLNTSGDEDAKIPWRRRVETKFNCDIRTESIPIRDRLIEKGMELKCHKVCEAPDRNGFFTGESEYGNDMELFCLTGFTDRPALY